MFILENRNILMFVLWYLSIGALCVQVVSNYYSAHGKRRVPIRFLFLWPLFLLLFGGAVVYSVINLAFRK